jgi:hypothetical protein
MKRILFGSYSWKVAIVSILVALSVSMPAIAKGQKDFSARGKCELTITNETGTSIEEIIIEQAGKDMDKVERIHCVIPKSGSTTIKIEKNVSYDILLVDTKKHQYGKKNLIWSDKSDSLTITKKDFVSQGAWDTFKKLVHF